MNNSLNKLFSAFSLLSSFNSTSLFAKTSFMSEHLGRRFGRLDLDQNLEFLRDAEVKPQAFLRNVFSYNQAQFNSLENRGVRGFVRIVDSFFFKQQQRWDRRGNLKPLRSHRAFFFLSTSNFSATGVLENCGSSRYLINTNKKFLDAFSRTLSPHFINDNKYSAAQFANFRTTQKNKFVGDFAVVVRPASSPFPSFSYKTHLTYQNSFDPLVAPAWRSSAACIDFDFLLLKGQYLSVLGTLRLPEVKTKVRASVNPLFYAFLVAYHDSRAFSTIGLGYLRLLSDQPFNFCIPLRSSLSHKARRRLWQGPVLSDKKKHQKILRGCSLLPAKLWKNAVRDGTPQRFFFDSALPNFYVKLMETITHILLPQSYLLALNEPGAAIIRTKFYKFEATSRRLVGVGRQKAQLNSAFVVLLVADIYSFFSVLTNTNSTNLLKSVIKLTPFNSFLIRSFYVRRYLKSLIMYTQLLVVQIGVTRKFLNYLNFLNGRIRGAPDPTISLSAFELVSKVGYSSASSLVLPLNLDYENNRHGMQTFAQLGVTSDHLAFFSLLSCVQFPYTHTVANLNLLNPISRVRNKNRRLRKFAGEVDLEFFDRLAQLMLNVNQELSSVCSSAPQLTSSLNVAAFRIEANQTWFFNALDSCTQLKLPETGFAFEKNFRTYDFAFMGLANLGTLCGRTRRDSRILKGVYFTFDAGFTNTDFQKRLFFTRARPLKISVTSLYWKVYFASKLYDF